MSDKPQAEEPVCEVCGYRLAKNFSGDWVVPLSATTAAKNCPRSPTGSHIPRAAVPVKQEPPQEVPLHTCTNGYACRGCGDKSCPVCAAQPEPEGANKPEWAGSGNYVADRVEAPEWVVFANGRTVGIAYPPDGHPHLVIGWEQKGERKLRAMAAAEDDAGSIVVGGLAVDVGLYRAEPARQEVRCINWPCQLPSGHNGPCSSSEPASPSTDAEREPDGEERALRRVLWQQHGHLGLYGDDGEMQCSECRADYLRDPLLDVVGKAHVALRTKLAEALRHLDYVMHTCNSEPGFYDRIDQADEFVKAALAQPATKGGQ